MKRLDITPWLALQSLVAAAAIAASQPGRCEMAEPQSLISARFLIEAKAVAGFAARQYERVLREQGPGELHLALSNGELRGELPGDEVSPAWEYQLVQAPSRSHPGSDEVLLFAHHRESEIVVTFLPLSRQGDAMSRKVEEELARQLVGHGADNLDGRHLLVISVPELEAGERERLARAEPRSEEWFRLKGPRADDFDRLAIERLGGKLTPRPEPWTREWFKWLRRAILTEISPSQVALGGLCGISAGAATGCVCGLRVALGVDAYFDPYPVAAAVSTLFILTAFGAPISNFEQRGTPTRQFLKRMARTALQGLPAFLFFAGPNGDPAGLAAGAWVFLQLKAAFFSQLLKDQIRARLAEDRARRQHPGFITFGKPGDLLYIELRTDQVLYGALWRPFRVVLLQTLDAAFSGLVDPLTLASVFLMKRGRWLAAKAHAERRMDPAAPDPVLEGTEREWKSVLEWLLKPSAALRKRLAPGACGQWFRGRQDRLGAEYDIENM